jgi:hypothetical protein
MGKTIELIVGRSGSSDIEIDNDLVSGRHLRILKLNTTVFVEDLGSTNGTTVDGEPLSKGIKKIITLDSHIILAKKIILDLTHYKIQSLELPPSSISKNHYTQDFDETEREEMFEENKHSFSTSFTPVIKRKKWYLFSMLFLMLSSITICLSGKFDLLCDSLMLHKKVQVEVPEKIVQAYVIVAPKFMGSSKSNSSVFFVNKTDSPMSVKLIDISIEGIPYDGIVVPLNGKGKFMVFANDTYDYKLIFEESVTKDLDIGKYLCKVIFKVILEGKKPKMERIEFPIEIVKH